MLTKSSESSSYVAGLDGLRALAVIAVLAFHLRLEVAPGGFLGVSLFFTLSGYLITQLLLRERQAHGRIDVRAFWIRRLRRLMPGALLVIGAVALAALAFDRFPSVRLRGDLFAALGYAANWRFMSASTSYADLFTSAPSPVLHFWSLAIEEQFYLVYPVLMAGLFVFRRKWIVPMVLGTLLAGSVLATLLASSHNVVYYGAHTRAAEILAGALLGLWFPLGGFADETSSRWARALRSPICNSVVFGAALAGFLVLVFFAETNDDWLYSGGLAAMSTVSILLLIGAQSPGLVRWLAERSLAVGIGGLSYGLYLFHWPIFLLVTEDTTPFEGWLLNVIRLAITVVAAWSSARFVERPIRLGTVLRTRRTAVMALVGAVSLAATVVAFVPRTPTPALAGLDAPDGFVTFGDGDELPEIEVLVVGSVPSAVELVRTSLEDDYRLELIDETDAQCPLASTPTCGEIVTRLDTLDRENRPDVVVLAFGALDRETVTASMSAVTPSTDVGSREAEFFDATKAYVDVIADSLATKPKILLDMGSADAMTAFMEDAALRSTTVTVMNMPTVADVAREVRTIRSMASGEDERERIMVIGDSTSYGISVAIDRLEGDRIDVLWAGGQNCPLVDVAAVKWWEGVEFDLERCPSVDVEWRRAMDAFRPSVVLIAVSVPEQADQRYPDDPQWYEPGSDRYVQVHDEFVARFMAEVEARGIEVMILDSPPIHGGSLGGAPFSSPMRVAIWNAQIARWAESWPEITVVRWSDALFAFESSPGSLRGDGVHLLQEDLDVLVSRALLPLIVEQLFGPETASAVEAEAEPVEGP